MNQRVYLPHWSALNRTHGLQSPLFDIVDPDFLVGVLDPRLSRPRFKPALAFRLTPKQMAGTLRRATLPDAFPLRVPQLQRCHSLGENRSASGCHEIAHKIRAGRERLQILPREFSRERIIDCGFILLRGGQWSGNGVIDDRGEVHPPSRECLDERTDFPIQPITGFHLNFSGQGGLGDKTVAAP